MLKINRKEKEADTNKVAIVITILILLGGFIFSYNYIEEKKNLAYSNIYETEDNSIKEQKPKEEKNLAPTVEENVKEVPKKTFSYNYIGYLEVPKIRLKRGFVSIDSKYNNVDKNIYIVATSSYPDLDGGNFIIAGHSGTAWNAFFNNLHEVGVGDKVYVTYNNVKYTYSINNIYEQNKTGKIAIYRDQTKTTLTLITCTNNKDDKQTVYIAYLEDKQNI